MSWCYGDWSRILIHGIRSSILCSEQMLSAFHYIGTVIFWRPQRDRLWEAFLHGFKISGPLVFDAKNDLALAGEVYPEFFLFFE